MSKEQTKTDNEFLTPKELGVTEDEFCRLMKVAEGFQAGKYLHVQNPRHMTWKDKSGLKLFNMRSWEQEFDCGTVCCIGGWAGLPQEVVNRKNNGLHNLCYPPDSKLADWRGITTEHAAKAIMNWARTGDPKWNEVVDGK